MTLARFVEAHIVGVFFARFTPRVAGRHGLFALPAHHESAQGKIRIEIRARRSIRLALQALLDALEGFKRDESFMLGFSQGDTPDGDCDMARIEHPRQNPVGGLVGDFSKAVFGKRGVRFEEPRHFGLGLEATRRIPRQCIPNNAGQGLFRDHHLAMAGSAFVCVAQCRWKRPIAIDQPRLLALLGLLGVFFAVVLGIQRLHVLKKPPVRVIPKDRGWAFHDGPAALNGVPQMQMDPNIPRQSGDVVHDDHKTPVFVLFQEGQHFQDALAIRTAARNPGILENLMDGIALPVSILAAISGLRLYAHARFYLCL